MINLDKKGYRISIGGWVGNLGNHLIQLSGAINVARNTQSRLTIPEHGLLRRRTFDFTDAKNDNCLEPITGRFFYKSDCFQFPIVYDRDRRVIFQDHLHAISMRRNLREHLHDLKNQKPGELVTPDTLVINMRSGKDIFRAEPPPQNDYMQPPINRVGLAVSDCEDDTGSLYETGGKGPGPGHRFEFIPFVVGEDERVWRGEHARK